MAPYVIALHDADGAVIETRTRNFEKDDDAIDHAGRIGHALEMKVWQGERLVAQFPPVRRTP
jgi:hypothetical protein